ncbi:DNA glycosylase AlkZ-like family protein [Pseudactinotalea suaedae]|uniref:DNA glycosylase AlkZ-like family protein n=1 Tax=Pseudactinotalea suaedae TaxID=1524924 RepID=UPI001F4F506E|nr:crosslink repair DNA glycosylase YcaQ family protein [Pseudactinotalea suaedae]
MHELSRQEARRIAVDAQWLGADRPADLLAFVRRATLLQLDPTSAIAPSADLVLWSRLGSGYRREDLSGALARRDLIELDALLRPAEDLALYTAAMAGWAERNEGSAVARWAQANEACANDILARLRDHGAMVSRQLPDTCVVPWSSTGWTNNRNVTQMLEVLVARGLVAVAGRSGKERLWDLALRVYPDVPAVPAEEASRRRDARRLRSLGLARARAAKHPMEPVHVGAAGEEAVVDGVPGTWRVDPAYLGGPLQPRVALLSPFDRLLHDRKRLEQLFSFTYVLEMYKPAAARRWGYYALPILYGADLVGKLDAAAKHDEGVLAVNAVHWEGEPSAAVRSAVDEEIEALATWLGLTVRR